MHTPLNTGLIVTSLAGLIGWSAPVLAVTCAPGGAEPDAAAVYEAVAPAVVTIEAVGDGDKAVGTGFLWDDAGHVVTNEHVIQSGRQVTVRFSDGRVAKPIMIAVAAHLDIAVLRVDATPAAKPITRAPSPKLKVGQWVFAIGNPYGVGVSLSRGIISGLDRPVDLGAGRRIEKAIQTDASLDLGGSGGPLLDAGGCLIGMATAVVAAPAGPSRVGFAMPVDLLERAVASLIGGPDKSTGAGTGGLAEPKALGIRAEDARPGVRVVSVAPGSHAAALGARPGDVITHADDRPVSDLADLAARLGKPEAGNMRLTLQRGGSSRTVEVLLASAKL
ncbi:2-alkenal reductase [Skermanella stibiiresistens SB22]|uniref:2-alkenal reductase n=1 Tax=Skermanella stibiiresistens SB22 TaxID=1385369 RepID=W9GR31_9PROT|nr:trypsin-like peptidase domain-containing protein [Skermanella stibiiresistens]EWY36365.1 2-alkenal reductase [Skermanella stibiiresistens SB22]